MNRRNFIKGFAGLAALAVASPSLAALTKTDRERLMSQMRNGGLIENQTFVIRDGRGIVLRNVKNLTIRNCRFIWTTPCEDALVTFDEGCECCEISYCHFDGAGRGWIRTTQPVAAEWSHGIDVEVEHLPEGIRWRPA